MAIEGMPIIGWAFKDKMVITGCLDELEKVNRRGHATVADVIALAGIFEDLASYAPSPLLAAWCRGQADNLRALLLRDEIEDLVPKAGVSNA